MEKLSFAFEKANIQKCHLSLRNDEFSFPRWQFVSKYPTAVRDDAVTFKGCQPVTGGRADFSKNLRA
jgi:hypothetical protein